MNKKDKTAEKQEKEITEKRGKELTEKDLEKVAGGVRRVVKV